MSGGVVPRSRWLEHRADGCVGTRCGRIPVGVGQGDSPSVGTWSVPMDGFVMSSIASMRRRSLKHGAKGGLRYPRARPQAPLQGRRFAGASAVSYPWTGKLVGGKLQSGVIP